MKTYDFNEMLAFKTPARVRAEISGISHYHIHSHKDCTEILCVLHGHVTAYDFAISYELGPGEIHIFNSNDPHKITSKDPDSIVLLIQIDKNRYLDSFSQLKTGYFVTHMIDSQWANYSEVRYLRFLLGKLYFEYIKIQPSDVALEETTKELIQLLYDYFHDYAYYTLDGNGYMIIRRRNEGQPEEEYLRIYRIADFIESTVGQKITLDEVAEKEFLNKTYLSSIIKKNIGVTFSELVSIARCSEVERLLASSSHSIDQIATDVGFANRGHLTKQFQKWYGVTPSQYRKQVLNDYKSKNVVNYHPFDKDYAESIVRAYMNG